MKIAVAFAIAFVAAGVILLSVGLLYVGTPLPSGLAEPTMAIALIVFAGSVVYLGKAS